MYTNLFNFQISDWFSTNFQLLKKNSKDTSLLKKGKINENKTTLPYRYNRSHNALQELNCEAKTQMV